MALHVRLNAAPGAAQDQRGIGVTGFFAALSVALCLFFIQISIFLYLRGKSNLRHIYNPKGKDDPPKAKQLASQFTTCSDAILQARGYWDAYYFLRYLRTLVIIFAPVMLVVLPILIPLNYVNGRGQDVDPSLQASSDGASWQVMGLDTLAFGNVRSSNTRRYTAHLVCALLVIVWFCGVSFTELRKYVETRPLVMSINQELQTQQSLVKTFGGNNVVGRAKTLDDLLRKRDEALNKFESVSTALVRCTEALNAVENEIIEKRQDFYPLAGQGCIGEVFEAVDCQPHRRPCNLCSAVRDSWSDVVWANVDVSCFKQRLRTAATAVVLAAMIIVWAIPVSCTAALSQLDNVIRNQRFRSFFQNHTTLRKFAVSVAGALPGIALALMVMIIPPILEFLSRMSGAKLKSQQASFVQRFYFVFLFVQMFLVVSIASFFTSSFEQFAHNLATLRSPGAILNLLSQNLPTAANYFFCYMVLQALSGSSSILMQKTPMFWFIVDKLFNYSPRQKWLRRDRMDIIGWGTVYPLYTTLACISLVYSVIAPLISVFAIVSFGMLWLAHRYSIVHVRQLGSDHAGILYPQAINQTFTGIYVMELCLTGLFFGVQDDIGKKTCIPHGIVMMVALVSTAVFQVILNVYTLRRRQKAKLVPRKQGGTLYNHLDLLLRSPAAWVPKSKTPCDIALAKSSSIYPPGNMECSSPSFGNQRWEAFLDGRGRVQINRQDYGSREKG